MGHLIFALILVVCVHATRQQLVNVTIGLFHGVDAPSLQLERTLQQITKTFSIQLEVRIFNVTNIEHRAFEIMSINAIKTMSFVIGTEVNSWIPKMVATILGIPLMETGHLPHFKTASHRDHPVNENEISMTPDTRYRSKALIKLLKLQSWIHVAVLFQAHRINDLNHFIQTLDTGIVVTALPVETSLNGSITLRSLPKIQSLTKGNFSAVLLIVDEASLPQLFELFRSSAVDLCPVRTNIVLLDLILGSSFHVCRLHTVVGLQIQKVRNSNETTYPALYHEALGANSSLKDALLCDTLSLVANITSALTTSNRWLPLSRDGPVDTHSARVLNTANFTAEARKIKFNGASGNIEISENGTRWNLPLNVVNVQGDKLVKIGTINGNLDVNLVKDPSINIKEDNENFYINGHINVVTIETEPFTFATKLSNGTVSYSGLCIDILEELAKTLNFTYSIYLVADNEYGRKNGSKWTGMIGDVLDKKADLAAASLTITSLREEAVEFTMPYMELQNAYLRQRKYKAEMDYLQFLKPFTTNVWILTLFVIVLSSVIIFAIDYKSPFGWRQLAERVEGIDASAFNAANSVWFCVASWLLQGGDNTPRSLSGRVFAFVLWFAILIVTSTYIANMAAFFTSTKAKSSAGDLESLLKAGATFIVKEHIATDQFLKNSDYKVYQIIAQKIKQENMYLNRSEGMKVMQKNPDAVMLSEAPYIEWAINQGQCDIEMVKGVLPSGGYGFPVRKGSPLSKKISIGIAILQESLFLKNRIDYYWKGLSKCSQDEAGTPSGRIEPRQLVGVYACLLIGIVLSFLFLFLEKWWKKKSLKKAGENRRKKPPIYDDLACSQGKIVANGKPETWETYL